MATPTRSSPDLTHVRADASFVPIGNPTTGLGVHMVRRSDSSHAPAPPMDQLHGADVAHASPLRAEPSPAHMGALQQPPRRSISASDATRTASPAPVPVLPAHVGADAAAALAMHRPQLFVPSDLQQSWPAPSNPRGVIQIGTGSIVRDMHLPTYTQMGLQIVGLYDVNPSASSALGRQFGVPVGASLDALVSTHGTTPVYDIAVPPQHIIDVLRQLPDGATVLIQKPLGRSLEEAKAIVALCEQKRLIAAVNFQLRFAPNILALRDALERDLIGNIHTAKVEVTWKQPWSHWPFTATAERLELLLHSIHYLDLLRFLFGDPTGVKCATTYDRSGSVRAETGSVTSLVYPDRSFQCTVEANHDHVAPQRSQAWGIRVEGERGVAIANWGPTEGERKDMKDTLAFAPADPHGAYTDVPLEGSRFPLAFRGPMNNLQRFAAGEDKVLVTSVRDALETMRLVEACYTDSQNAGTPLPH